MHVYVVQVCMNNYAGLLDYQQRGGKEGNTKQVLNIASPFLFIKIAAYVCISKTKKKGKTNNFADNKMAEMLKQLSEPIKFQKKTTNSPFTFGKNCIIIKKKNQ